MNTQTLKRLPTLAAVALVFLAVAACAIRLRGDEESMKMSASAGVAANPRKLAECRSVTYDQKDALSECRKAWAEKRQQFLGQKAPSAPGDNGTPQEGSSLFVPPKDETRLPSVLPEQFGKE